LTGAESLEIEPFAMDARDPGVVGQDDPRIQHADRTSIVHVLQRRLDDGHVVCRLDAHLHRGHAAIAVYRALHLHLIARLQLGEIDPACLRHLRMGPIAVV
jgi:hypothetical protein